MPPRFLWLVPLAAWVIAIQGCSTVPREGAETAGTLAGLETAEAAIPRQTPEQAERRASAHARFLNALTLELNNEVERAEQEYEKALELDPENEGLAIDLSRRYIQQKNTDKAIAVLQRAVDAPNASAPTHARLGLVYLQAGRTNDAIAANESAIKRQPSAIVGYQNLYGLYRQTGRTNEARQVLDQAGRQKKVDAPFLIDLAGLYLMEDVPKMTGTNSAVSPRAHTALDRAAGMSPTNLMVLQKLAQGYRLVGESKKASDIYARLVKEYPRLPGLREELTELLLRSNDTKAAADQLNELVRENPTNPQAYVLLGAIAYEEQRYADAVDNYRKALLLNPGLEQLYYDIAGAKIALNESKEALEWLAQAEKKFKASFVGEFFKAVTYVRLKDYTNAIDHFTAAEVMGRAGETNRLTHTFYFQFAAAHERAGQIAEAEKLFGKTLEMSPNFAEALNYLGYMWAERGTNLARARDMIEKAVSISPTNSAYLDSLGWVLFKQGHAREALPHIEKAIELDKEPDATLYDHLGDIHAVMNDLEKARDAWRKSIKIEPNKDIEKKLENADKKIGG
jgi:tetratricopeptide (TPR) repeat protein